MLPLPTIRDTVLQNTEQFSLIKICCGVRAASGTLIHNQFIYGLLDVSDVSQMYVTEII